MKTSFFKSLYVQVLTAIAIGILLGHFYPLFPLLPRMAPSPHCGIPTTLFRGGDRLLTWLIHGVVFSQKPIDE